MHSDSGPELSHDDERHRLEDIIFRLQWTEENNCD